MSAAAEPSATCVPRGLEVSSPASVFEPEEGDETAPSEVRDPGDDGDRLAPWDQSWTPFDNDDDEELQA